MRIASVYPPRWCLILFAATLPAFCVAYATGAAPGRLSSPDGSYLLEVRAGPGSAGASEWEMAISDSDGTSILDGRASMDGDTARIAWDEEGRAWLFDEGSGGIWFCERYEGGWRLTDWRDRFLWYGLPELLPPEELFRKGAARRMVTMERRDGYSIFTCLPQVALDIPLLADSLAAFAGTRADRLRDYAALPVEDRAPAEAELTYRMLYSLEPSPEGLVCILGSDFSYAGGMHGMYWFQSFIFDTGTGTFIEPLSLAGDSAAQEAFCRAVADSLSVMLAGDVEHIDTGASCDPENYRTVLPVPASQGQPGGLRVIFDVGQVGCYAAGEMEVVVEPWPPGPPTEMTFARIPSGSFEMGSPANGPGSDDYNWPVHTVTFDYSFEMMTTEVTQGMWEEVMGTSLQHQMSLSEFDIGLAGTGDSYPMYYVSWDDCQDFADAMNALDPAHEYRLPSEAEWEYCCRAGTTTCFYWGDDPSQSQIDQYAWFIANTGGYPVGATHPVAQKIPNEWGLFDMSGNVKEWCQDEWHRNYIKAPSDGSAWESSPGSYRVGRGGCWDGLDQSCGAAYRGYLNPPGDTGNIMGFRLVRSAR